MTTRDPNFSSRLHDEAALLKRKSEGIEAMVDSLNNIGNYFMANYLSNLAGELLCSAARIRYAVNVQVNDMMSQAAASEAALIKGIMSGVISRPKRTPLDESIILTEVGDEG